jgi:hypothetical protein
MSTARFILLSLPFVALLTGCTATQPKQNIWDSGWSSQNTSIIVGIESQE